MPERPTECQVPIDAPFCSLLVLVIMPSSVVHVFLLPSRLWRWENAAAHRRKLCIRAMGGNAGPALDIR